MLTSITKFFNPESSKVVPLGTGAIVNIWLNGGIMPRRLTAFTVHDVYVEAEKYLREMRKKKQFRSISPDRLSVMIYFKHRFLPNKNVGLIEYGVTNNSTLDIKIVGLTGGCTRSNAHVYETIQFHPCITGIKPGVSDFILSEKKNYQVYNIIKPIKCGKLYLPTSISVLIENDVLNKKEPNLYLQAEAEHDYKIVLESMNQYKNSLNSSFGKIPVTKWIEAAYHVYHFSKKCETWVDVMHLAGMGYQLFTGDSLCEKILEKLSIFKEPELQAMDLGDFLATARGMLNGVTESTENIMYKKLHGTFCYLLVHGWLKNFGLELDDDNYAKVEQRTMLQAYSGKMGFMKNVLDTALFMCERLHEWYQTGDISRFIHSSDQYAEFTKKADKLISLKEFTSDLTPHGYSFFKYMAELDELIEQGEVYTKYTDPDSSVTKTVIRSKWLALKLIKNTEVTRKAALKMRKAPMGILIHGHSSVGKSSFDDMVADYYGKLMNLPAGDEFHYTLNPGTEFFDNFRTYMWHVKIDDAAYQHPDKAMQIDPTLSMIIQIFNNVAFTAPQASLEDKGKTPMRPELVTVTTNTIHLNAQMYFTCPLAVRRRIPLIVTVEPLPEYRMNDNKIFLDPSKLNAPEDAGKYPNYWTITVKKIVPHIQAELETCNLEVVEVFTDTTEFLAYFGKKCIEHEQHQQEALKAMLKTRDVAVCRSCFKPGYGCRCVRLNVQGQFLDMWTFNPMQLIMSGVYNTIQFGYDSFFQLKFVHKTLCIISQVKLGRKIVNHSVTYIKNEVLQSQILGMLNSGVNNPKVYRAMKIACGLLAVTALSYVAYDKLKPKVEEEPKTEVTAVDTQGMIVSNPADIFEKEKTRNVWYNPTNKVSKFDVTVATSSLAGASDERIIDIFSKNVLHLSIRYADRHMTRHQHGFMLCGNVCVANKHLFESGYASYLITVTSGPANNGLNINQEVLLRSEHIIEFGPDIVSFRISSLPPYKDISKFVVVERDMYISRGLQILRSKEGEVITREIFMGTFYPDMTIQGLEGFYPVYMSKIKNKTEVGNCGALTLAITPRGPAIVGIHICGDGNIAGSVSINKQISDKILQHFGTKYPIVQGGGEPNISCSYRTWTLKPLHPKSVVRYVENASMRVYGTFDGFRPQSKSKVCATPLQNVMVEHYNKAVAHGAPAMLGYEHTRINLLKLAKRDFVIDEVILQHCVEGFANDILSSLDKTGDWKKQLCFLNRRDAVNGLCGVKFIDGLNKATSMGFPWGTTKKQFLHHEPTQDLPDAVNFDAEFWERVDKIEECYNNSRRCYPVFSLHDKDEALPLAKVKAKKVRGFTGSPTDFSIVVRQCLLPFIRLVQKNKFAFEAAIGTVCQSTEWEGVYEFLTEFGKDRMFAGDFEAFDKRMGAVIIIAAGQVIHKIFEAAGAEPLELQYIACIFSDVAFNCVNFNGDLIEFLGSNPSGWPMTVIINSFAGSLYTRYAYYLTNPNKEVKSFQTNVKLVTYGDDNAGGVNEKCTFFNHTAMQEALATIGVRYTMADKEAKSVPFITINQVSFLKRTWRMDDEVGHFLGPLEELSIFKSLTVWVPSDDLDKYEQMLEVMISANNEYFFYGREKFNEKHKFFKSIMQQEPYCFYTNKKLPTYDELLERFYMSSGIYRKKNSNLLEEIVMC